MKKQLNKQWWFLGLILLLIIGGFGLTMLFGGGGSNENIAKKDSIESIDSGKTQEEKKSNNDEKTGDNTSNNDYYERNIKTTIGEITQEYDEMLEGKLEPIFVEIHEGDNSNLDDLKTNLDSINTQYQELSEKISVIKVDGLEDESSKLLKDYKENMDMAIEYSNYASSVIKEVIDGTSDVATGMEEAKALIQLSKLSFFQASANIYTVEENLGIKE